MPPASKLNYRTVPNTALPYVTNTSPTSAAPQYVGGSNVLTSIKGQAERRPGFAQKLEPFPVTLGAGEVIKRTFPWSKWDGTHYVMYSTVDATQSYIYKFAVGSNATAVKIFTSSSTEPFWYQTANNLVLMGNETDMVKFRATTTADVLVYKWGIAAPTGIPGVSTSGTGIDASTGYYYVTTSWNDNTGHESGPSPLSALLSPFTNKTVTVTWIDGNDSATGITNQITHTKVYRTTDGGSTDTSKMQLVSKVAVGVQTLADATTDANLGTEYAPARNYNDPPPAAKLGCYSQGRIWMFVNSTVWMTGYEEISKGVPEECVPGATLGILGGGNAWNYDKPVKAVAPRPDGISVFMPLRIDGIQGDSVDTFRRYLILANRGTNSQANVSWFGSDIVWLDTSGQLWHSVLGEIGQDIRPDVAVIDQTKSSVAIHISGIFHHVYLLDGATGKLWCFDMDTKIWMPPWPIASSAYGIYSGETAVGTIDLLVAHNGTKVLKQTQAVYSDDGTTYAASVKFGLLHISQTSPLKERYDVANPQWRGVVDNVEIKTNTQLPSDVRLLIDDDPFLATGTSIVSGVMDIPDAVQGTFLRQVRYPVGTLMEDASKSCKGRMASLEIQWASNPFNFVLDHFDMGYYPHAT